MKVSHILTALAATGVALASASVAQAVTITSSGVWTSGTTQAGFAPGGVGTDTISWGDPFLPQNPAGLPSSYVFEGNAGTEVEDSALFIDGAFFKIGTFTHNNFTITGDTLDDATLTVDLDIGGTASSFNFGFTHNETPNNPPIFSGCAIPGTAPPCPDQVSIPSLTSSESIEIAGSEFNLQVVGFLTDDSDITSGAEAFTTIEAQANSAWIVGQLTPVPGAPTPVIPPPVSLDM